MRTRTEKLNLFERAGHNMQHLFSTWCERSPGRTAGTNPCEKAMPSACTSEEHRATAAAAAATSLAPVICVMTLGFVTIALVCPVQSCRGCVGVSDMCPLGADGRPLAHIHSTTICRPTRPCKDAIELGAKICSGLPLRLMFAEGTREHGKRYGGRAGRNRCMLSRR